MPETKRKFKYKACQRCGTPGNYKTLNRKGYCFTCGMERAVESIRQMAEKSGPFYDEWVKAQKRYARQLGEQK